MKFLENLIIFKENNFIEGNMIQSRIQYIFHSRGAGTGGAGGAIAPPIFASLL